METSLSDLSGATLAITFPLPDFQCWDWGLFAASSLCDLVGALLDSLHAPLSRSQTRFLYQFNHRFPVAESQMPGSLKLFSHSAVTQKQLGLVPLRRDPKWRNPVAFYTLPVCARRSCSSSWVLSSCCLFLSCLLAGLRSPLSCKGSAGHGLLPQLGPCLPRAQPAACSAVCTLNYLH